MSVRPVNNMNYKVAILGPNGGVVEAWIPEQFNLRLQSDWEPLLSNMLDSMGLGRVNEFESMMNGKAFFAQFATGQVWRRTEPIEFNLDLLFDAETSAFNDVTLPVKQLIRWATPSLEGGYTLRAPGPTIYPYNPEGMFSMRIGRFLYIRNVIFPAMDVTWHTAPQASGDFIAADVNLTVRTFYTPTQQDILSWFIGGKGVAGPNAVPRISGPQ